MCDLPPNYSNFTGMSYLENQIQPKQLGLGSESHFFVHGLGLYIGTC